MANYSNLKAAIADVIKTNGTKAITGQVLQDTLNSIVSVIGANYQFAGVATPSTNPGTPDQNVFYFATETGLYPNFGGVNLERRSLYLLMWNGSWHVDDSLGLDDIYEDYIQQFINLLEQYQPIVIEGNVVNAPDEEDLTSVNDLLKFKNKAYFPENFSGLGRVFLRKNIVNGANVLTQAMMSEANTIYIIQYDYTLGEDITVPANCVLEFDGGSISASGSNDTIIGDSLRIEAGKNQIFKGAIKVEGEFSNNCFFYVDWWITNPNYSFIKTGAGIDNSVDIQNAIDSGAKKLVFSSNRFYYLASTLVINGNIDLFSDKDISTPNNSLRNATQEKCCIYSNEIIELLNYNFQAKNYKNSLYIGCIDFFCNKHFTNLEDRNKAIVTVHSASTITAWGVKIKCNIKSVDCEVNIRDEYGLDTELITYALSYTGLRLAADGGNMSFVEFSGDINYLYKAIDAYSSNGYWFTDITIKGNSWCSLGGTFGDVTPVKIYGSHQPYYTFPEKNNLQDIGYFNGNWINLYGTVWDIDGHRGRLYTVGHAIQITEIDGRYDITSTVRGFVKNSMPQYYRNIYELPCDLFTATNLLKALLTPNLCNYVNSFEYTISNDGFVTNEDIRNSSFGTLYNGDELFGTDNNLYASGSDATQLFYVQSPYFTANAAGTYSFKVKFKIVKQWSRQLFSLLFNFMYDMHIKVYDTKTIIDKDISARGYTPHGGYVIYDIFDGSIMDYVFIEISFNRNLTANISVALPNIALKGIINTHLQIGGPSSNRPNINDRLDYKIGLMYFDTTLKKPIYWTADKSGGKSGWVDATGTPV